MENRLGNLTKSLKSLSRTLEIEEIYLFHYQMLPPLPHLSALSTTMFLTYFYLLNYLPLCSNTIDYLKYYICIKVESLSFVPKLQTINKYFQPFYLRWCHQLQCRMVVASRVNTHSTPLQHFSYDAVKLRFTVWVEVTRMYYNTGKYINDFIEALLFNY